MKKIYILIRPDRSPDARFGAVLKTFHETPGGAQSMVSERRWYQRGSVWLANHDLSIHEAELLP